MVKYVTCNLNNLLNSWCYQLASIHDFLNNDDSWGFNMMVLCSLMITPTITRHEFRPRNQETSTFLKANIPRDTLTELLPVMLPMEASAYGSWATLVTCTTCTSVKMSNMFFSLSWLIRNILIILILIYQITWRYPTKFILTDTQKHRGFSCSAAALEANVSGKDVPKAT